ncbi:NYN domain-containing protein [Microcoleus sp. ZQ-A2]|nr:NYN domain-containing protein [Microcoleus sp. FACHB-1]
MIAVFWDYENTKVPAQGINLPLAEALIAYSESLGHPKILRVYSNWQREKSAVSVQALYSLGFEPIHVSMGKPNSVDLKLAIDCLSTAYNHSEIEQFIIVTADKDFIPLVNALKALKKRVIIVGKADVVSEHLMLSAHDFVSLETLPKYLNSSQELVYDETKATISYEDAVKCLIAAIDESRDQGKSTRLSLINNLMMASKHYPNYSGIASVRKADGTIFPQFDAFIAAVEADKKIKVKTVGSFKELFLIDEDPQAESKFIEQKSDKIDNSQWVIVINQIQKAFQEGDPSQYWYGKYGHLHKYIRAARKDGEITVSNRTLQTVVNRLVEVGMLILQDEGCYRIIEDLETKKLDIIRQLTKSY